MQLFLFIWFLYNSTCFGRSFASIIRSNLQTVGAATGVYPRCGIK